MRGAMYSSRVNPYGWWQDQYLNIGSIPCPHFGTETNIAMMKIVYVMVERKKQTWSTLLRGNVYTQRGSDRSLGTHLIGTHLIGTHFIGFLPDLVLIIRCFSVKGACRGAPSSSGATTLSYSEGDWSENRFGSCGVWSKISSLFDCVPLGVSTSSSSSFSSTILGSSLVDTTGSGSGKSSRRKKTYPTTTDSTNPKITQ